MLLIYSTHITPRVDYIFKLMLEEIAGFKINITTNKQEYLSYEGPSVNYSFETLKQNEVFVEPNGLLFQSSITALRAIIDKQNDESYLYLEGDVVDKNIFDPFAAAFYLVSRYEEYLSFAPDEFGRFEAKSSVLFRHDLLELPLVDKWSLTLQKRVQSVFPRIETRVRKFSQVVTIDIDQAYAFQHRGVKKNSISFVKNLVQRKTELLKTQVDLIINKAKDPYDSYQYLQGIQNETAIPFIYFVNIGVYSKYDKNLSPSNLAFKRLLNEINSYATVGLHPSYFSNDADLMLINEKNQLEKILDGTVKKSRQHYLKLIFPNTYRNLIEIGIEEDYTMGFASYPGFRAGTCTPFFWFDLEKNSVTGLKVFPTTYMDGTFIEDLNLTPHEADKKISSLTETVKKYNGCYISIWHNHTVSNQLYWKNWRAVFENSLKKLKEYS